ncbi:hypothetical protein CO675_22215 [Bradyrhizobium sp. C9]|nr:hypothetical protein CO675_22215 [Bradyrhizobium sp. C9]
MFPFVPGFAVRSVGIPPEHAHFLADAAHRPECEREATVARSRRLAFLYSERRAGWTETILALSGRGQDGRSAS